MIAREDAERLKDELLAILQEDAHNAERLVQRLDQIAHETGLGAHSALMLILTGLPLEEDEARRHWDEILRRRHEMSLSLARDVGVRVAALDYFVNVNRRATHPSLVDLSVGDAPRDGATADPMTGLATDRGFRAALLNELRRARRYEQHASVVLFDFDDFGAVVARCGEIVARRLMREAAILLHNKIRDIDLAACPGEDELALLLPETDRNGALLVAERFRREVESHFHRREIDGRPVELTISGGVASYPDDATAGDALIAAAARALYGAKASGKNAVQLHLRERRRFLRFDLDPERCEVEVLAPRDLGARAARSLSRSGLLFACPEPLDVGEEIEIRVIGRDASGASILRMRGRVVRLEEIPPPPEGVSAPDDRFEVGVAFDPDPTTGDKDLIEFLERYLQRAGSGPA